MVPFIFKPVYICLHSENADENWLEMKVTTYREERMIWICYYMYCGAQILCLGSRQARGYSDTPSVENFVWPLRGHSACPFATNGWTWENIWNDSPFSSLILYRLRGKSLKSLRQGRDGDWLWTANPAKQGYSGRRQLKNGDWFGGHGRKSIQWGPFIMVHGYMVFWAIWSIFSWSQPTSAIP